MGTTILEGLTVVDSPQPVAISGDLEDERHLTEEIDRLWEARQSYDGSIRSQRTAMRSLDKTLAEMLYAMKTVLSKPGRSGGWSEFLRDRKFPRATADRWINRYQQTLGDDNCLNEAVTEPTEEDVQKVFTRVWPKLRCKLPTTKSVYWFVSNLAAASGIGHEFRDGGIFMLETLSENAEEAPANTTPPETGQATAVAGTNVGDA